MLVSIHGVDRESDWLGWFEVKVCLCESYGYRKDDYPWPAEPNWKQPPTCRHCSKFDRQLVMECQKCWQKFYRWFSHPKNGFYHDRAHNPVGWFCYSCLENDPPLGLTMVPINRQKHKVPPVELIVPPDYKHAAKIELPASVQSNLDAFLAKLKGIQCQNLSSEQS